MNPWLRPYDDLADDRNLSSNMEHVPATLGQLSQRSASLASLELEHFLNEIFLPTPNTLAIARKILNRARLHIETVYSGTAAYREKMFDYRPDSFSVLPMCLTGLAGVGKSALLKALKRSLDVVSYVDVGMGYKTVIRPCIYFPVCSHGSVSNVTRSIVAQFIDPAVEHAAHDRPSTPHESRRPTGYSMNSQEAAKWLAFRDGTGVILLDELQFITHSETANTLATKVIYATGYIGPPLVFASNYDMVTRIQRRGQQDRDRLLTDPAVLRPDSLYHADDVESWQRYLRACVTVSGDALAPDLDYFFEEIHHMSYGLRRKTVTLLSLAYGIAREHSRNTATIKDLRDAYSSQNFSTHRLDVEALRNIDANGGRNPRARIDGNSSSSLICPFPEAQADTFVRQVAELGRQTLDLSNKATLSAYSPKERSEYKASGGVVETAADEKMKRKMPTTRRPKKAGELIAGTRDLLNSGSRRKPTMK